jgi:hypothetical protein
LSQSNGLRFALVMAVVVVFLCAAYPLAAQAIGTVRGTVTDAATHQPLSGAQIIVVGGVRRAVTNESGEYTLTPIPAGSLTLRTDLLGYTTATRAITVAAGQTATADFALVTNAIPLDTAASSSAMGATKTVPSPSTVRLGQIDPALAADGRDRAHPVDLTPLLLNEVQQQRRVIESQQRAIDELQRRVALLEQKK